MTDETTPETLPLVGWYCWRCEGLNAQACRSDAVPVHVPAEWADDMRREIARLEEEDDEQDAAAAYGRALDTPPSDQAATYMRERLASGNPPRRTSQPAVPDGVRDQYAARAFNAVAPALKRVDQQLPLSARKAVAEAILAELKPELASLAGYENTINWMTTCTSCAQVLDSSIRETERAVKAEAEVAAARKFAADLRDFCSPHGVATGYADRLIEAMDRAKGEEG